MELLSGSQALSAFCVSGSRQHYHLPSHTSWHPTEAPLYRCVSSVTVQNETGALVGVGTVFWIAHIDSSDMYVPVTYF